MAKVIHLNGGLLPITADGSVKVRPMECWYEPKNEIQRALAEAWEGVIRSVLSRRDVTDDQLKLVGEVMAKNPAMAAQVYDAIDLSGGFWSRSSEAWTRQRPYHTAALATENAYVLKGVRNNLLFPTPQPPEVPMVMPPPPPATHQ